MPRTRLTLEELRSWGWSRRSHFARLVVPGRYRPVRPDMDDLKVYQDLLVLTALCDLLPRGARVLEVGGGDSRVGRLLGRRYEWWNLDGFEGLGHGPAAPRGDVPYRVVRGYLGHGLPELAQGYFQAVVSISALEHTPEDPEIHAAVARELVRVSAPGCLHVHLLDAVLGAEGLWQAGLAQLLAQTFPLVAPLPTRQALVADPDLHVLGAAGYARWWQPLTGQSYTDFGRPLSANLCWRIGYLESSTAPEAAEETSRA